MNFMEICIEKGKAEGRIEGKAEGRIEGKAEGRIEGKAEGRIEGKAEGRIEGKAEAVIELLEDYGTVPEKVQETVFAEKNSDVLKKWLKLAAQVTSIEEFLTKM